MNSSAKTVTPVTANTAKLSAPATTSSTITAMNTSIWISVSTNSATKREPTPASGNSSETPSGVAMRSVSCTPVLMPQA